jgi:hypothetical protein
MITRWATSSLTHSMSLLAKSQDIPAAAQPKPVIPGSKAKQVAQRSIELRLATGIGLFFRHLR